MSMSIEVIPTGAAVGAEIRGLDIAKPIDDSTFAEIERAYNEYGVIFFREQRITAPQQVAFTRRFGEIEFNIFGERWSVEGSPEIVVVSNVTEGGQPIGVRRAGENWHSDMCYAARPPRGTMLYALEIPDLFGLPLGDTEFASAAAAWDALPDSLRHRIEGRRAIFDFTGRKRAFPPTQAEIDRYPPVTHPIVRTHPYTGRQKPLCHARRLHRHRRYPATGIRGADRRARRPHREAGLHLSPPMASRRSPVVGQLYRAAPGDPGLRPAAPAAYAPNHDGRHGAGLVRRRGRAQACCPGRFRPGRTLWLFWLHYLGVSLPPLMRQLDVLYGDCISIGVEIG